MEGLFGALGEDLVGVLWGALHDAVDFSDVVRVGIWVEEVGHGVDEDHAGLFPVEWFAQGFVAGTPDLTGPVFVFDGVFIGAVGLHDGEAGGHAFGVAVGAAR